MKAGCWGLGAGINLTTLLFFLFAMVPKYIYLENVRHKHRLNPMRLALCLATSSDRITEKNRDCH